jgi:plasmid maintenance system killer protein
MASSFKLLEIDRRFVDYMYIEIKFPDLIRQSGNLLCMHNPIVDRSRSHSPSRSPEIVSVIDAATSINDLRTPPGNRLEKLSGDRIGQYSIRINDQWRICFTWTDENNAADVEIVDYH